MPAFPPKSHIRISHVQHVQQHDKLDGGAVPKYAKLQRASIIKAEAVGKLKACIALRGKERSDCFVQLGLLNKLYQTSAKVEDVDSVSTAKGILVQASMGRRRTSTYREPETNALQTQAKPETTLVQTQATWGRRRRRRRVFRRRTIRRRFLRRRFIRRRFIRRRFIDWGALKRKATAWVNRQINSFRRSLTRMYNSAVAALRRTWNRIKAAAKRTWNRLKNGAVRMFNYLKNKAQAAIKAVLSVVKRLLRALPMWRYTRFSNIYVKCLTNPKRCNPSAARLPSITICFSKIGCLGPTPSPRLNQIGSWLKNQLWPKVKAWFARKILWKTINLKFPIGIKTTRKPFYLRYPSGLRWCHKKVFFIRVRYPCGFSYRSKLLARIPIPSGLRYRHSRLRFPYGFNFSGGDRRLVSTALVSKSTKIVAKPKVSQRLVSKSTNIKAKSKISETNTKLKAELSKLNKQLKSEPLEDDRY